MDRVAAGAAQFVLTDRKTVSYRDTLIEHKALALPHALALGYAFEVLENPALKVVDLRDAGLLEQRGGFFAANSPCAEHGDPRVAPRDRVVHRAKPGVR